MKKILFCSVLSIGAALFCSQKTSAQVSVHVRGVIGEDARPVYRQYPVYQNVRENLPPGQAKKLYGYKSAKHFAPGHAKRAKQHLYEVYDGGYEVYTAPSRPRVVIDAHVRL
jgi:hypothetical protein